MQMSPPCELFQPGDEPQCGALAAAAGPDQHKELLVVDLDGQVLDCWLSRTRDLAAALAFFRRTIGSTGCTPEHVVTDKAAFYSSTIRTCAPHAKHTATGFYNLVISTNRCERSRGYVKYAFVPCAD